MAIKNKPLEAQVINAYITNTSNKLSEEFPSDEPTKTAYLKPASEEDREMMLSFGMTEYTPKNDKKEDKEPAEPFFIAKLAHNVACYIGEEDEPVIKSGDIMAGEGSARQPNFKTNKAIAMNIIKGYYKNSFFRVQALQLDSMSDLITIQAQNPFKQIQESEEL